MDPWYSRLPKPRDGYKYETTRDLYFHHAGIDPHLYVECWSFDFRVCTFRGGVRIVHAGYRWDGATSSPDMPCVLRESVAHDIDCQFQCMPVYRELIADRATGDRWFRQGIAARSKILAAIYYTGVRIGSLRKPVQHDGLLVIDLTPRH